MAPCSIPQQCCVSPLQSYSYPLRRQLKAELAQLSEIFAQCTMHHPMRDFLQEWCADFMQDLTKSANEPHTLAKHIESLQQHLCDPNGSPLEQESFLGNDNHVYGLQGLYYHLHRSPYNSSFTVESDPAVSAAVHWLHLHNSAQSPLPLIASYYQQLHSLGPLPKIPTKQHVLLQQRIAQLKLRNSEREAACNASVQQILNNTQHSVAQFTDQIFTDIASAMDNARAKEQQRIDTNRAITAQELQTLHDEEMLLKSRNRALHARITTLETSIEEVHHQTATLAQESAHLQQEIQATKQALNHSSNHNALVQLAAAVACIAISQGTGLSAAISELGIHIGPVIPI